MLQPIPFRGKQLKVVDLGQNNLSTQFCQLSIESDVGAVEFHLDFLLYTRIQTENDVGAGG
jgi:hypothetical protein